MPFHSLRAVFPVIRELTSFSRSNSSMMAQTNTPVPTSADPGIQYILNWTVQQTQAQANIVQKIGDVEVAVLGRVDNLTKTVDALSKETDNRFHVTHARMDQFERFRNAQGKLNTKVNSRLTALEKSTRRAVSQPLEDRMSDELVKIRSWVEEARMLEHTVVLGPSQGNPPLTRADVDKLLDDFGNNFTAKCEQRGRTGVFSVKFTASTNSSPKALAKSFITYITELGTVDNIWAKLDEPTNLRMAMGRARRFAYDLKSKISEAPYFQFVEGFLVFGSVLVAPVSLIPDEEHWPTLGNIVMETLLTDHVPFSFTKTTQSQLHRSICGFLLTEAAKPRLLGPQDSRDDRTMDESTILESTNL